LQEHNFVISDIIQQHLAAGQVYISLFNSYVKLHAKKNMHALLKYH